MKVIVAVKDKLAGLYFQPMFMPSVGVAYRSVQDEAAKGGEGNVLSVHPEDFALFELGTYDEVTGVIVAEPVPKFLAEVSALTIKE